MRAEKTVTQGVNTNALSHICVVYNYSQEINVNVGVHPRSVLSTLLIIMIIWCRITIASRLESVIKVKPDKLEVVAFFFYLSDMLSVDRGCDVAVSTYDQTDCKTFRELLSVLTPCHPLKSHVAICRALTCGAPSSKAVKSGR